MKLTNEARQAINETMAEIHEDGRPSREIAARLVTAMQDMEPSGLPWVGTYMEELAIIGAQKVCADWRRAQARKARTKRGAVTSAPAFVGQTTPTGEAVQRSFDDLDLEGIERHIARMSKQRNTLSTEIQFFKELAEIIAAGEAATVGEARTVHAERAA